MSDYNIRTEKIFILNLKTFLRLLGKIYLAYKPNASKLSKQRKLPMVSSLKETGKGLETIFIVVQYYYCQVQAYLITQTNFKYDILRLTQLVRYTGSAIFYFHFQTLNKFRKTKNRSYLRYLDLVGPASMDWGLLIHTCTFLI